MSREVRLSDRIKELSYDPGTSRFALTGPVDGFSPFSDFYQQGDVVFYAATDGTRYEVGSGEYTLDGSTKVLTRYPLRSSSLSSGPYYINGESTSGPTKGTTGYFHPLYLMESSASGLRGYPTEFGANPPTAVHEHHFAKYPGVTFYMPQEYNGHAETVGGGAPAALSGVSYAASGAAVSFQGVTEVFVTYPGKYSVFSAHGVSGYQEPKHGGVAVWGSEQILDYDRNIVWNFDNEALGISQPSPIFPVDVGGASSYSQVRASGFIDGGSGIAFSGGQALPQDSLKTASGGRQLEPFFRNELDNQTKSDQVFSLSGLVDQRLLLKMQEKGTIFAGPPSGCSTVGCDPDYPHFRYLELEDIPDLSDLYVVQKNLIDAGLVPVGAVPHWDASGVIVYDPSFVYNSTTDSLGVGTDSPQSTLDVNGDITASGNIYASGLAEIAGDLMVRGDVTVSGGLDIQGSLTYIDSTTVTLLDKQIELASMSGSPPDNYNDAFIDDGGIVLKGTQGDKKWTWRDATDSWTTSQGLDASGITFNDLSVISGAYHPGSGLELHNQIELHVGNLFQVSGEDGTNCFIHQGGALIASGISGIDTTVTKIGNSGRLVIDPTYLKNTVLGHADSKIDALSGWTTAGSGLVINKFDSSGNFLLSSGIQVSGWSRHYTNARVGDSGNKVFDAASGLIHNSGNFLLSSGVQVSGWAGHQVAALSGWTTASSGFLVNKFDTSGNFLLSSGVEVSGWTNHNFTKTNSTITELSGILSGVDLTLHRDINHSGNMLKDLIGGGGGSMSNWTIATKNTAGATASETIADSQTLNVEGRSGIVTEYKASNNRIFIGQDFASGNFLLSSGVQVSGWAGHQVAALSGWTTASSGFLVNKFDSSGNFLLSSGITVSGWANHNFTKTNSTITELSGILSGVDLLLDSNIKYSGNFLLSSGVQVSGWAGYKVASLSGWTTASSGFLVDKFDTSGNSFVDRLNSSGNFLLASGVGISGWAREYIDDASGYLDTRITTLTAADDNYGHWKPKVTNSFGTKTVNIASTQALEFKGGGTAATSGINIQFDTSANQIQFGVDFTSGNKILDTMYELSGILSGVTGGGGGLSGVDYKIDASGQALKTLIGSVINYGHWHVKTTNQAGATADEEVTTDQDVIFKGQSGIATEYVPGTNTLTISLSSGVESPLHDVQRSGNRTVDRLNSSGNFLLASGGVQVSGWAGHQVVALSGWTTAGSGFLVNKFDTSGNANLFVTQVSGQHIIRRASGITAAVSGWADYRVASLSGWTTASSGFIIDKFDTSGQKFFSAVSGQYLNDALFASGQNIENKFNSVYSNIYGSGRVALESGVVISGLLAETSGNIFAHVHRQSGVFRKDIADNSGIVVQLSGQAITAATSGLQIVNGVNLAKTVKLDPASSGEIRSLMFRRRGAYEDIRIGREAGIAQKFGASNDIAGAFFDSNGISNPEDAGDSISVGTKAGYNTVRSSRTILIGTDAGSEASGISDLVAIGTNAAKGMSAADSLDNLSFGPDYYDAKVKGVVIGTEAGQNAQLEYGKLIGVYFTVAIGDKSQKDTFHALDCTSLGASTLIGGKQTSLVTAIGYQAGAFAAESSQTVTIGTDSCYLASGLLTSTFIGSQAGYFAKNVPNASQKVEQVVAIGYRAAYKCSGVYESISMGHLAGANIPEGENSVRLANGWEPLSDAEHNYNYRQNISIGDYAGYQQKGSYNISIGKYAGRYRGNASAGDAATYSTIIMPDRGYGWSASNTISAWYNKDRTLNNIDHILLLGYDNATHNAPLGGYRSSIYVGDPQDRTDFSDYTFTIDRHNNFLGGLKLRGASSTSLPFLMAETSVAAYPENEIINNHGFLTLPGAGSSSTEKFYYRLDYHRDFNNNFSIDVNNPRRIYDKNGNDIPTEQGMVVIAHRLKFNKMPTDSSAIEATALCVRQGNKWQLIKILNQELY